MESVEAQKQMASPAEGVRILSIGHSNHEPGRFLQLLQQAGVSNLSFEIIAPTNLSGAFVTSAELMQANLKEIGVTTTIKTADTATFLTAQQNGTFFVSVGAYALGGPSAYLSSRVYTGSPLNYPKFSDPELDKMIDQQATMAKDEAGRKKVLQDIQRRIIDNAATLPLVLYDFPIVQVPEMKDLYPPTYTSSHNTFWVSVWFDK